MKGECFQPVGLNPEELAVSVTIAQLLHQLPGSLLRQLKAIGAKRYLPAPEVPEVAVVVR
jgi:hypothetical protein